jgi:hypothetical protein
VAATLAKGAAQPLHVLSVYDYPPVETTDLPPDLAVRHREELLWRTDTLMVDKLEAYVAPLRAEGVEVSPILRVGNPREVIAEVATSLKADLLIAVSANLLHGFDQFNLQKGVRKGFPLTCQ